MDNGHTSVDAGDKLAYAITVTNLGAAAVKNLTVTQTLPSGATFVSADADGRHRGSAVTWKVKLKPSAKVVMRSTLTVADATPEDLLRLASVACAQVTAKGPPLVCAADSDQLPAGAVAQAAADAAVQPPVTPVSRLPWWAPAGAGVVLLLGLVGGLLARRRRVRTVTQPMADSSV